MRVTKAIKKEQLRRLEETYKDEGTMLHYTSPFTLLVAVILSAQCTDKRVNIITARMFPRLDTPQKMVALSLSGMAHELLTKFNGEVPEDFDDLVSLPGVGRKTANVVRSVAFGYPAIAVDTHVFRVSNRLKLAIGDTPEKVEEELKKVIPMKNWSRAHHWLIWHGRRICHARNPKCQVCPLLNVCPSAMIKVSAWKP